MYNIIFLEYFIVEARIKIVVSVIFIGFCSILYFYVLHYYKKLYELFSLKVFVLVLNNNKIVRVSAPFAPSAGLKASFTYF